MPLISEVQDSPITLRLARDLVRTIKRGHPWVFAEALRRQPAAPPGTRALLLDNKKGRIIARGFYDAHSPLAFRVCTVDPDERLDDAWATKSMARALSLRRLMIKSDTTGYRLFNGEGDALPGLICDVYGDIAVIQLDGAGPSGFWNSQGVAMWIADALSLSGVYVKNQSRPGRNSQISGQALVGQLPPGPISFIENGILFTADIVKGQKTGFFLDQRENRQAIKKVAADRRVLNLFGYTGGFSVYAGLGGADRVTTVDRAGGALEAARHHWQLNRLTESHHETVRTDALAFLKKSAKTRRVWDLVIVDPPSFAPSKGAVSKAVSAYQSLIAAAAGVTAADGLLAVASCSSHIDLATFLNICENGVSKARRRATLLRVSGQPPDHPTPLTFSEFRYLKFILMRIE